MKTKLLNFLTAYSPVFAILFATVFSILYQGYYFGQNDGALYIPYLKNLAHPGLYQHDLFVQTWKTVYFANLWRVLAFFSNVVPVKTLFLTTHILSRLFFYASVYLLMQQLFRNKTAGVFAVILWSVAKPSLGFDILYNEFVQSEVGIPILLFSLLYFLRKRFLISFIFLAITFHIHPPMAGFLFVCYVTTLLFEKQYKILIQLVLSVGIIASPILLQTILFEKNITGYDSTWIMLTKIRSPHHSFPSTWQFIIWAPFVIYAIFSLISLKQTYSSLKHVSEYYLLLVPMFVILISGYIFSEIIPVGKIIAAVPFHITPLLSIVLSFPLVYWTYLQLHEKRLFFQLIGTFCFSFFFFTDAVFHYNRTALLVIVTSLVCSALSTIFIQRWRKISFASVFILFFMGSLIFGLLPVMSRKAVTRKDDFFNNWIAAQQWAKTHTDTRTVFIVPIYLEGFRVFSERAIVTDWKDGSGGYLSPVFLSEWWRRMEKFGLTQYHYTDNYQKQMYRSLSYQQILLLSKTYHAGYFVTDAIKEPDGMEKVYANKTFKIFKIL